MFWKKKCWQTKENIGAITFKMPKTISEDKDERKNYFNSEFYSTKIQWFSVVNLIKSEISAFPWDPSSPSLSLSRPFLFLSTFFDFSPRSLFKISFLPTKVFSPPNLTFSFHFLHFFLLTLFALAWFYYQIHASYSVL